MYINHLTDITKELYPIVNNLANELDIELINILEFRCNMAFIVLDKNSKDASLYKYIVDNIPSSEYARGYLTISNRKNYLEFFTHLLKSTLKDRLLLEECLTLNEGAIC